MAFVALIISDWVGSMDVGGFLYDRSEGLSVLLDGDSISRNDFRSCLPRYRTSSDE